MVKKFPTTTDILSRISSAAHADTQENTYVQLIQLLAEKFECQKSILCVPEQQNGAIYSKFFACWDTTSESLSQIDKSLAITEIEDDIFSKHAKTIREQPKQELVISTNGYEASFRSSLYYFVFRMHNKISPTEQILLGQFLESTIVTLSTFFQLAKLTQHVIFYEEENDLLKEIVSSQNSLDRANLKYSYSDITGESKALLKLLRYLDQVIEYSDKHDLIYIHGESGTGKSLLARSIHRYSGRSANSFIEVNCGAIVDNLCEAEFFGIAPQSGIANVSKDGKPGLFELADNGIIFLDEISELSLTMQASLLTVIEGKPFRRVCGNKDIKVDVRIISASIHDIKKMPPSQFLPELAQRLDGIRIEVPPLRERKQDIDKLVDYLRKQLSPQRQKNITPQMRKVFKRYDWPGNIRELSNCVRRCSISGELPQHLQNLLHSEECGEMKTFDELLNIEKKTIITNRVQFMVAHNPGCTLVDVANSFGLKRDALRRRLHDIGYTWDEIKQQCLEKI